MRREGSISHDHLRWWAASGRNHGLVRTLAKDTPTSKIPSKFNLDLNLCISTYKFITATSAKMTKRTKKVGVTGKYGTRYVMIL